jgi:hypothetical protein
MASLLRQVMVTSLPFKKQQNCIGYIVTVTEAEQIVSVTLLFYRAMKDCTGYFFTVTNGDTSVALIK